MGGEELIFEGCNFFRQRLTYSVLSGRPVLIRNIRKDDDAPGIKDFEAKLLSLLERVTNGTRVEINATGTEIRFRPGIITGGVSTMDCGSERCLSYFLEPMIILSPFCKNAMTLKLKGVTNAPNEVSVDAIKATWLTVYNKFVINDEKLELKISARGLKPAGGGCVTFSAPIVKILRPVQVLEHYFKSPLYSYTVQLFVVQREKQGKICKIRGQAYVTKVTPSLAYRMIDAAKTMLHGYIADVYITVDQRKGDAGGNSPGYGLFLTAETTEGVVYHGEAISRPKGEPGDPLIPEDVGSSAATALLEEIYRGGCLDSSAQMLACSFMALGQKDISKFLFGPLTVYCVHALRHLKDFFEIQFKVDEWSTLRKLNNSKEDEDELRLGSEQKALVAAVGIGFSNLNKTVL
ncbi:18S rRNA biogenesis protein RCL1 [Necator americanus]|uniref:18S rRNA biogenesis protein RCL1 n=1 Tax=Necator americanus TaxID=51031 RepID=W2TZ30_NECAM|nr:18S rRNA biogenesis protein RCL1 [Necator americanus]ETN86277.1 18S rRNA biogenesis protein RCL1 [Necator americanus]